MIWGLWLHLGLFLGLLWGSKATSMVWMVSVGQKNKVEVFPLARTSPHERLCFRFSEQEVSHHPSAMVVDIRNYRICATTSLSEQLEPFLVESPKFLPFIRSSHPAPSGTNGGSYGKVTSITLRPESFGLEMEADEATITGAVFDLVPGKDPFDAITAGYRERGVHHFVGDDLFNQYPQQLQNDFYYGIRVTSKKVSPFFPCRLEEAGNYVVGFFGKEGTPQPWPKMYKIPFEVLRFTHEDWVWRSWQGNTVDERFGDEVLSLYRTALEITANDAMRTPRQWVELYHQTFPPNGEIYLKDAHERCASVMIEVARKYRERL